MKVLHVPETVSPEALMAYVETGALPEGSVEEPIEDFMARGRVKDCDCDMIECVCLQIRQHKKRCPYCVALICPVEVLCRKHKLEVCPECDACTCGAKK
jgi:hypothetical protein